MRPHHIHSTHSIMKNPIITACLVLSGLGMTCVAQEPIINCIQRANADWHDESSWQHDMLPSEGELAIINGGHSGFVDQPFEAPIQVQVGNGVSEPPDGALTINADFQVKCLALAIATGTSGRVEQNAGVVSLEELNIASMSADAFEATYDLFGGTIITDVLKLGVAGPATLNLAGSGEVVTVQGRLLAGSQATLRFTGGDSGFPALNATTADITIEPGATLVVEADGAGSQPGKFTLIEAYDPLAASFNVELVGFAAGKASLLQNEPGVVLEVK